MDSFASVDGPGGTRPHIVVLGAGFAGLNAAHALRRIDADVTLLDKNNYHTFQPLLYQVSTGYLPPRSRCRSSRSLSSTDKFDRAGRRSRRGELGAARGALPGLLYGAL
jgi:2-polyprenyl-6-methoxyphenol hydroxylase-like FAD-dependent oxidoreductase